jgi:capsule biosynthesis phosphatase
LTIFPDDNLIIITQKKHEVKKSLYHLITQRYNFSKVSWIEIDEVTNGQLETALLAKNYLNLDGSIAIFNCDTFFQSKNLLNLINNSEIDGIIPCSQEPGTAWSFCEIDEYNHILDVAEKNRISDWCSVGFYYFKDSGLFCQKAEKYIKEARFKETYVAPFYLEYIKEGFNLVMDPVTSFKPMGTPEQIESYWNLDIQTVINSNYKKVLVVDIDDTLTIDNSSSDYSSKKPRLDIIQKLHEYKAKGYQIILHTARRMKTFSNDEAKIIADISQITINWLNAHNVPYDGIKFGKPHAENGFYIDDKTIRPNEFLELDESEIYKLISD